MISKNVKRKRRENKKLNAYLSSVSMKKLDNRTGHWLISVPLAENESLHKEVRGYKSAIQLIRVINAEIREAYKKSTKRGCVNDFYDVGMLFSISFINK